MTHSTMLQLKISKTKKRLSSTRWYFQNVVLSILGLLGILGFCLRSTSLSWEFGRIEGQIPVMPMSIEDPHVNNQIQNYKYTIQKDTPTVIITPKQFYFGDLEGFTVKFENIHNKFFVPHDDGRPQIGILLEDINKWKNARLSKGIKDHKVLVLMPTNEVPVNIVIQVIYWLKESTLFEQVVLANELI